MHIISHLSLAIPNIKVITFSRYRDERGYFTEQMRNSDFAAAEISQLPIEWVQMNESFSKKGVIRGLHFQWDPFMGKLIRTVSGHMIDLILDIRKGSPHYGKIIAFDMPCRIDDSMGTWIWVPPGFAHGNFFLQDSIIEYLCTGEYNSECEAGISPLSSDIDWSLCDTQLKQRFDALLRTTPIMTEKDKNGFTLGQWDNDIRSFRFLA